MGLIFKYLKKYVLWVVVIIGLTYLQAQTELALPDYMSDIVTNGIQYGGITSDVPMIISKSDMDNILLFVPDENVDDVVNSYELIKQGSISVVENQEIEFIEDTYLLKQDNEDLSLLLQKPLLYSYLSTQINTVVNEDNVKEIKILMDEKLVGLEDNYSSMVKVYIQQLYANGNMNIQTLQTNYILHVGLTMLAISLLSIVAQIGSTYLATKISTKIASTMRKDVFEKVESFSSSEFSKFSTSSLITRTGNDITKVQMLIQMMLRMMLMSPIMGITAISKVVKYPSISWLLLVAVGVMLGVLAIIIIFALPKFEIIQKMTDRINSIMREFLDGMLVIRAFNAQKAEENKFDDVNSGLYKVDLFVNRLMNLAIPTMTIVMNGLTVLITWFSAKQIDIDVMTIGDMMAFIQYAMHVVMSFMFVTVTFFMVPRSLVSARRINEVLKTNNTIKDIDTPKQLPDTNGKLVFDKVSFKYPGGDEYVLENISFEVNPSETVAIIGSTGSGKSTIVKLIPRLFDVNDGCIKYCDINIKDLKQDELHNRIGYISQKAILFKGSIKENIEFGRVVSDDELNNAIDVSQSRGIVDENDEKIDYEISQGGSNLSGGQKQRLAIARALAKDKSIYIFDDSFSALDYATDRKLRNELAKLIEKNKASLIIVAQRISTIKNADKIIVLDEGKIVGIGKHKELLNDCEVYKQIAYSQLSKEELA